METIRLKNERVKVVVCDLYTAEKLPIQKV